MFQTGTEARVPLYEHKLLSFLSVVIQRFSTLRAAVE
jgi:hypothetical protein